MPVADLDGQPERGERGDTTHTPEPGHHRGEQRIGGHRRDRPIQPIAAIHSGQHRIEGGVIGLLQPRGLEPLPA
jgi:hypothetical protein